MCIFGVVCGRIRDDARGTRESLRTGFGCKGVGWCKLQGASYDLNERARGRASGAAFFPETGASRPEAQLNPTQRTPVLLNAEH
jgi:hypothetical protein